MTEISRMGAMLKQVAPTGTVKFGSSPPNLIFEPNGGDWWVGMIKELENKAKEIPGLEGIPGERHILYGVVSPDAPGMDTGGIGLLGAPVAASRTTVIRFPPAGGLPPTPGQNVEASVDVMAHETGHTFGLDHTGSQKPFSASMPGCWGPGSVNNPNEYPDILYWPYGNNYVQPPPAVVFDNGNYLFSGSPTNPNKEVGLDFKRNRPLGTADGAPYQSFEMMGYCEPRWVTPWSYRGIYAGLKDTATIVIPMGNGEFDEIAGTITDSGLVLNPIFTVSGTGSTDSGSGSYRIEERNSSGSVLFVRSFTPHMSTTDSTSGDIQGPPHFVERVPHQTGVAAIAVIDNTGTQLRSVALGGTAPTVSMIFPAGGEVLSGMQKVIWSAITTTGSSLVFRVQYSADNGTTWNSLVMAYPAQTLFINFDQLPGASGTALIRVYASDGISTGQATSKPFSVPRKLPQAKISYPANGTVFHVGDFLNLEGIGFEANTGILSGASLTWSSSGLGGTLGTGDEVSFGFLGESAVGTQTIKLTATDTAGNQASTSIDILVQEQPPVVYPDLSPAADAGASYIGTEGSPVVFSGGGSYASDFMALTYAWNFGDGGTASGQSPSHVYADNGIYQVTLTVSDQKGRPAAATATTTIANVPPTVVAGAAITGKNTRPINLTASFSDPGLHDAPWRVTWSFGDGSTSPTSSVNAQGVVAINHTYQAVGQSQVKVTVTDKDGGSSSAAIPVTIASIGDVNNDGKVNCADMAIVKGSLGKKTGQAGFDARADLTGDGIVNVLDLSSVARQLPVGTTCP